MPSECESYIPCKPDEETAYILEWDDEDKDSEYCGLEYISSRDKLVRRMLDLVDTYDEVTLKVSSV